MRPPGEHELGYMEKYLAVLRHKEEGASLPVGIVKDKSLNDMYARARRWRERSMPPGSTLDDMAAAIASGRLRMRASASSLRASDNVWVHLVSELAESIGPMGVAALCGVTSDQVAAWKGGSDTPSAKHRTTIQKGLAVLWTKDIFLGEDGILDYATYESVASAFERYSRAARQSRPAKGGTGD